jgi:Kef-type K+ transport system membrane component KefB
LRPARHDPSVPLGDLDRQLLLLTLQIGVIIGASRLLGVLMRHIGQPPVMGELIAGLLLGPSFLGWMAPGVSAALFPAAAMPQLKMLAELGIVLFMFLIGLELNPALLRRHGRAAVVISTTSIVVPFALGVAIALALHQPFAGPGVSRLGFAGFLGAAMAITAFPVLARILIERRMLRSPLGTLTLACAAVDDIAGWGLLALVAAVGRTRGVVDALTVLVWVVAYVGLMVAVVRPRLGRLAALRDRRGEVSQNLLAIVLILLLGSALATQWIGIHAIFGGFLMGTIMPRVGGFGRELAEKLEDFVTVFFLPVYFAYTGLRTHLGLLDSPGAWLVCGLLVAVAVAGKFGGGAVAARLMGSSWRESAALGALVNTRGLMELVILNVGLDLGLITPTLFAMMVLMAITTTMMTSPAIALIDPHGHLRSDR